MPLIHLAVLFGLVLSPLQGGSAEQMFRAGCALYLQGDFDGAMEAFGEGRAWGERPGLFHFNQGNCLFRLGRYGEALFHYRTAEGRLPRDSGVIRNIRIARARLGLEDASVFDRSAAGRLGTFTPIEYVSAAALLGSGALLFAALSLLKACRAARRIALGLALTAVLALLCGIHLAAGLGGRFGVAVKACEILSEPSAEAGRRIASLSEGEEVRVEERLDGWQRLSLPEGRAGWVRGGTVRIFR
jgi:tetratricopeptide (TPR) repeat protein